MVDNTFGPALGPRGLSVNALFAALLAASAVLALHVPGTAAPITLQMLVVVLVALIVPPSWAAVAVGTYVLAGAVGLPVFAGLRGGLGVIAGPTGGFLIGFVLAAPLGAQVRVLLRRTPRRALSDAAAAATVVVVTYLIAWLWLAWITGMGPLAALLGGVVPYIVPDALKAFAALLLAPMVRRAVRL